jgi:glycolate oxidase FAD binding subunit
MNTAPERLRPSSIAELCELIASAQAETWLLELRGGGSKAEMRDPGRPATLVDLTAFSGIVDYDPRELVLTARAATPLAEIERLLGEHGQMLAFEPYDHASLYGRRPGSATLGGVIAANVSGPRRLAAGGARDHVLGFEGVSGRAEAFKAGGRVVKNVTGYDLPRLLTGSWGRLVALTSVTLKVLPRPRTEQTVLVEGPSGAAAIALMARALGSTAEVTAAAHLPAGLSAPQARVALRLEGFAPSVAARAAGLIERCREAGVVSRIDGAESAAFWAQVRVAALLPQSETLWRVTLPPAAGQDFAGQLDAGRCRHFFDWAGGLVWVAAPAGTDVRAAAQRTGGQAVLVRAPPAERARVGTLHPEPAAIAALRARLKAAFDPGGILDPDRFALAGGRA